ncbi:MAG: MarR family transcriptional regulator [Bacillota bacterium]
MAKGKSPEESGEVAVTLVGRDIEDARRILGQITRAADRRSILEGARSVAAASPNNDEDERRDNFALKLFALREARRRFLPELVWSEPAWDILLTAYLADKAGARHTVGRIVELSRTSTTTALRHIDALEEAALVQRVQDRRDRRIFQVLISGEGRKAVDKILSYALKR